MEEYPIFNKIIKILRIDDTKALITYSKALLLFKELKNYKALGVVYNNIGCLHF